MQRIPGVLTADELTLIRQIYDSATFNNHQLTAESFAVKNNLQLDKDEPAIEALNRTVIGALSRNELFQATVRPAQFVPPLHLRYGAGMLYEAHVDAAVFTSELGRTLRADVSITVFLNDPAEYDGGELVLDLPGGPLAVKLPAGDAIVYSTHTVHQVRPVTRGERMVAVTWAQSQVRDPLMRQILFDLHAVSLSLKESAPDSIERRLLMKTERNLLRLVAE